MEQERAESNLLRYLSSTPEAEAWGVAVAAGGRQAIVPGEAYPPQNHPDDHMFRWETGRVLGACQIVFITSGRGRFESRETGLVEVTAGTAIVILPGVWHRYAPDAETGWTELWIELQGPTIGRLVKQDVLDPHRAVVPVRRALELERLMKSIHARLLGAEATGLDPERAALGLQVLAIVAGTQRASAEVRLHAPAINRAERLLAANVDTPPGMPELARELGMAYSLFRREFKRHTGLAPYQYLQQLRLEKARRLIGNTDESIKEIADRLGFASAYHLSAAFKARYGEAPAHWRHRDLG